MTPAHVKAGVVSDAESDTAARRNVIQLHMRFRQFIDPPAEPFGRDRIQHGLDDHKSVALERGRQRTKDNACTNCELIG